MMQYENRAPPVAYFIDFISNIQKYRAVMKFYKKFIERQKWRSRPYRKWKWKFFVESYEKKNTKEKCNNYS